MNAPAFEIQREAKIRNAKFQIKKTLILIVFFGALFALSYYLVNFIDLGDKPLATSPKVVSNNNLVAGNGQLAQFAPTSNVSMADFDAWAQVNNLQGADVYNADPDQDGLPNYLEYIYGTDPNNKDTDGDGFSDKQEIVNGYDPDAKGEAKPIVTIKIAKIGVSAPMVWSQTDIEADMLKDLENGLSHFVKTAAPGQNGNMIVSGHSSNYIWAKGNYNHIFKDLNNLEKGDTVTVQTMQRNGRIITFQYQVSDKFIAAPDDERIFADSSNSVLTLSTCWPIGTNLKRIIVKANLVQ